VCVCGRPGRWFVNSQVHITLIGVAIVYHLLAALNIHSLAADSLSMAASVALVAALVWLHVFLKTLGEVAVLSYFNIAVNVALLCTVVAASLERPPASPPRTALVASDAFAFGSAFASFGFAYGVHPVLPSVRASMRSPRLYPRTVVASMAGTLLFYLPISAVCYARYGDAVRSPVMDTPPLAGSPAVHIVTAAITAHLVLSYPLLAITPEAALEGLLRVESRAAPLLWRIGVRSAFVAFTAAVALLVRTPERWARSPRRPDCRYAWQSHLYACRTGLGRSSTSSPPAPLLSPSSSSPPPSTSSCAACGACTRSRLRGTASSSPLRRSAPSSGLSMRSTPWRRVFERSEISVARQCARQSIES